MKFRCSGSYYIPDWMDARSDGKRYHLLEDNGSLDFILQSMVLSLEQLFCQYPMLLDKDRILNLVQRSKDCSFLLGVDPRKCYHYFGEERGIYQGVTIDFGDLFQEGDMFLIHFIRNQGFCQSKVLSYLDMRSGFLLPQNIVEVKREDHRMIQNDFSPKVLKREKIVIQH